jgi:hypothetical protein
MVGFGKNDPGVMCCFCDKNIVTSHIDPCDINILTNWDKAPEKQQNQTFWCHIGCFREVLHGNVKRHLVVDLLSNDD